jgi:hypothetical protein
MTSLVFSLLVLNQMLPTENTTVTNGTTVPNDQVIPVEKPLPTPVPNPIPDVPPSGIKPVGNLEHDQILIGVPKPQFLPTLPAWLTKFSISGFARLGVFYTFPFDDNSAIGGNGGFRVADFRLNVDFRPVDRFRAYASIELAAPLVSETDALNGRKVVELRDAFLQYDICKGFIVRAGQMRPGYYAEMLLGDDVVRFTGRSILASGVAPPEGYVTPALAPNRQVGIQFFSKRLGDKIGFKYAVGVFDGNGQNQLFNDNNSVMPVARVEVDYSEHVSLGINASYNSITEGIRPTRITTNQINYGADIEAHGYGISGIAAFLGRSSTFSYAGLQGESALGAMGQVAYAHDESGLEGAARVAYLDPSSTRLDDALIEVTAMVGYRPFKLPFRILLQFTHREEHKSVAIPNDSLDLMWHAVW